MRLKDFICSNIKEISAEWEIFAGTLIPEEKFSPEELRNSIEKLLKTIANNMASPQSNLQQSEKAKGKATSKPIVEAAEKHVANRLQMGLSSKQLISEFRALRASVLSLWEKERDTPDGTDLYDLTRFNEAIDETLTEAESIYTNKRDKTRELTLGILAHDLRNPLFAISGAAELILRNPHHERNADMAKQILISAGSMSHLIVDLIDLTRVSAGQGIPLEPVKTNLRELLLNAIEEIETVYPERRFRLEIDSDLSGVWDEGKLNQVLSNLLANAVKHGFPHTEIIIKAQEVREGVEIQVHNEGPAIPSKLVPKLFDKFVQERPGKDGHKGSMGLGLYIAKEIVQAHGGTIKVHSSDTEGTTFVTCLPLTPPHHLGVYQQPAL